MIRKIHLAAARIAGGAASTKGKVVTMRKLLAASLVVGVVGGAGVALADPGLSNIPAHRHYVRTPAGDLVQVGPRVCDNPSLQRAFNEFHNNVHRLNDGIGPVAPGLHNGIGADLLAGPC